MLAPSQNSILSGREETCLLLEKTALFEGLPESVLNHFADKSQRVRADKGKVLFLQGDEAQWFYVIVSGWVKLFRETMEGDEAVIDVLSARCVFGEQSIFDDHRYNVSAEAVETAQLLAIPTSLLQYYAEKEARMSRNLLSVMARQRRQQHNEIEHLTLQNTPQRIGCFLLRLCPANATSAQLHLPYDKTLIAARLGMKPETFSRALAKLKTDVSLTIHGNTVVIDNIEQLVHYTCSHCSAHFPCEDIILD